MSLQDASARDADKHRAHVVVAAAAASAGGGGGSWSNNHVLTDFKKDTLDYYEAL